LAQPPFRETSSAASSGGDAGSDKSEFEDKVHQDGDIFKARIDVLIGKLMNPKPEKDEGADKYVTDKSRKDSKDNKHEKHEKELKEVIKEQDGGGVFQPFTPFDPSAAQTAQLMARVAALEAEIGRLRHFISRNQRPDVAKGALKDEPDST